MASSTSLDAWSPGCRHDPSRCHARLTDGLPDPPVFGPVYSLPVPAGSSLGTPGQRCPPPPAHWATPMPSVLPCPSRCPGICHPQLMLSHTHKAHRGAVTALPHPESCPFPGSLPTVPPWVRPPGGPGSEGTQPQQALVLLVEAPGTRTEVNHPGSSWSGQSVSPRPKGPATQVARRPPWCCGPSPLPAPHRCFFLVRVPVPAGGRWSWAGTRPR